MNLFLSSLSFDEDGLIDSNNKADSSSLLTFSLSLRVTLPSLMIGKATISTKRQVMLKIFICQKFPTNYSIDVFHFLVFIRL